MEGRRPGQSLPAGGRGQVVRGRPSTEFPSSQLLLTVPKTVHSPGPPWLERKASEALLPGRLTGKEALEEVRGTRQGNQQYL